MKSAMIVATVTPFSGTTTADKNGEASVMLQCIAGTMPNRNVLSGTVAERTGLEVGKTYLLSVRKSGVDKLFGDDYNFVKVMELTTAVDILTASASLGEAKVEFVDRPEGFENLYKRKGDVVEGARAQRIKAGLYIPAISSAAGNHATASAVKLGTSLFGGGLILKEDLKTPNAKQEPEVVAVIGTEK